MGKPIIYVFHAVDEGINRVVVIGRDGNIDLGHWIKRGVSGRICDPHYPRQFFDWREFSDDNGQVL